MENSYHDSYEKGEVELESIRWEFEELKERLELYSEEKKKAGEQRLHDPVELLLIHLGFENVLGGLRALENIGYSSKRNRRDINYIVRSQQVIENVLARALERDRDSSKAAVNKLIERIMSGPDNTKPTI